VIRAYGRWNCPSKAVRSYDVLAFLKAELPGISIELSDVLLKKASLASSSKLEGKSITYNSVNL
jgi:hypothetical protein